MIKLFYLPIIIVLVVSFSFAQGQQKRKIVFVNDYNFEGKTGITKLNKAWQVVESADCFPPCSRNQLEKQRKIIVDPVLNEISNSLNQLEAENDIVILRMSKIDDRLIDINENLDITDQFVKFFNENFGTENFPKVELIESNVARINLSLLFDETNGVKRLLEISKKIYQRLNRKSTSSEKVDLERIKSNIFKYADSGETAEISRIYESLGKFTRIKGFNILFDANQKIPDELKDFPVQDITKEFISYYNQIKP